MDDQQAKLQRPISETASLHSVIVKAACDLGQCGPSQAPQSRTPGVIKCTEDYQTRAEDCQRIAQDSRTRISKERASSVIQTAPATPRPVDNNSPSSPAFSMQSGEDESTQTVYRDNPRDARNRAEKQRRDKLNGVISELASLVPRVADANRKIDKTGVLRLTAHELRKEYAFGEAPARCHMDPRPTAASAFVDMMGGFLLTTTCKGIIVVVTPNVEQFLGYSEIDLLGQSIFNLTHPDDRKIFHEQLLPQTTLVSDNGELILPDDPDLVDQISDQLQEEKREFHIRIKRAPLKSEPTTYEMCYINGSLRKADHANSSSSTKAQVRRTRARGYDVSSPSGNDILFIGMVHVIKNTFLKEKLMEAAKQEYQTRHSIDGKIIECDQRISLVAGYLTREVAGMNAMTFMHREDVRWVIIALRQMYDSNKAIGESCYRLMSRTGTFIYLKTRGFLEIDTGTNAAKTFICINSLVTDEEGRRLNEQMKRNFSVIIERFEDSAPDNAESCNITALPIEDPNQLEQVIMHLVTNLPTPSTSAAAQPSSSGQSSAVHSLSIIAPERALIKTAIARSVNLLSETLKMNLERSTNSQSANTHTSSHLLFSKSELSKIEEDSKSFQSGEHDDFCDEYNYFINTENKTSLEAYTSSDSSIQNLPEYSLDVCEQELNEMYTSSSISENSDAGLCEIIPDIPVTSNNPCNGIEVGIPTYTSFASNILTNTVMDQVLTTVSIDLTDDSIDYDPSNNATTAPSTSSHCGNNKRTSHDALGEQYNTGSCKRKLPMHSENNEQLDEYGDNHKSNEYDSEYHFNNNNINEQDGFETFIEELINPSAELCEVVPRSLAVLESTITHMDGTMQILNAQHQEFQEELTTEHQNNFNEMMMEHQEHKQILESIQHDHLTQTDDITPPAT